MYHRYGAVVCFVPLFLFVSDDSNPVHHPPRLTIQSTVVPVLTAFGLNTVIEPAFESNTTEYAISTTLPSLTATSVATNYTQVACSFFYGGQNYSCGAPFTFQAAPYPSDLSASLYITNDHPPIYTNYTFVTERFTCNITDVVVEVVGENINCMTAPAADYQTQTTCMSVTPVQAVNISFNSIGSCGAGQAQFVLQASSSATQATTAEWFGCENVTTSTGTQTYQCSLVDGYNVFRIVAENALNVSTPSYSYVQLTQGRVR